MTAAFMNSPKYTNVCTGEPVARPPEREPVDTRATMPPPTQNTLRPAAFNSPSLFMGEGAGGWGFVARNVNRGEPWLALFCRRTLGAFIAIYHRRSG